MKYISFLLFLTISLKAFSARYIEKKPLQEKEQGYRLKEPENPGYNLPARYDVKGAWDFYLYGDLLFWQAREDGLEYGVTSSGPSTSAPINGNVLGVDFSWKPGVRLGFGFFTEKDDWSVDIVWSHIVVHNNTSSTAPSGGTLFTTRTHPATQANFSSDASSSWRCTSDVGDSLLGRPFYIGKALIFKPFAGARGFWIRQSYHTEYENVNGTPNRTERVRERYNSWGIGPRVALDTDWLIGEGFRIFSQTGFSLLFSRYYPKIRETDSSSNPEIVFSLDHRKSNFQPRPNANAGLGFGWGSYLNNMSIHVDFSALYEIQYWWGQNASLFFLNTPTNGKFLTSGDLVFHGGSFRARIDF